MTVCPLCGRGIVTERNCPVCGYEVGSDPEIDNDPVPVGGLPDSILEQQKAERKRKIRSVVPGFGLLLFVVGLLIRVNGGPEWVLAIGILILLICLIAFVNGVWKMSAKAWWNSRRWMAYGEEPDWARKTDREC